MSSVQDWLESAINHNHAGDRETAISALVRAVRDLAAASAGSAAGAPPPASAAPGWVTLPGAMRVINLHRVAMIDFTRDDDGWQADLFFHEPDAPYSTDYSKTDMSAVSVFGQDALALRAALGLPPA